MVQHSKNLASAVVPSNMMADRFGTTVPTEWGGAGEHYDQRSCGPEGVQGKPGGAGIGGARKSWKMRKRRRRDGRGVGED